MHSGQLVAFVNKGSEGFTVETDNGSVVDFGTEFGITINKQHNIDVTVFQGGVELQGKPIKGKVLKKGIKLNIGDSGRVGPSGVARTASRGQQ